MHFVIDIGNTCVKTALTDNGAVICSLRSPLTDAKVLEMACDSRVTSGICSAVRGLSPEELDFLGSLPYPVLRLTGGTPMPLTISYRTPQTLGPDRIAAAVGAWGRSPGCNLLVIDVGTAITYDVVTSQGEYIGGNISPGKDLRFKALYTYTGKRPLVTECGDVPVLGYSTETAIRSGVMTGIRNEMLGFISQMESQYDSLLVFFTGGDAEKFEIPIKNRIFADEFLLMEGLDLICRFNEKN